MVRVAAAGASVRVDMHLHTALSHDCLSAPDLVVAAALARGVQRICVTDHNEIDAALYLAARHGARVIVGEEVRTAEGVDIIGLFLKERIPARTPARETCEWIHAQGGIVYVPHPFAKGKGGEGRLLDEIADLVDAVEGFNARIHEPERNERGAAWGRARGIPLGAGSDAHTLREVGRAYVELPPFEPTPAGFLEALRAGTLHGRSSSRLVHLASTYAKARKRVPW